MFDLKINKIIFCDFVLVFFYKVVLDLSYYFIISNVWNYARFDLNFNILKLFESFFLLFIIFILAPKYFKKLSNIMIWLLVLISYVPMLTLFSFMDQPRIYMYAVTAFWLMIFSLMKIKFPKISLRSLKQAGIIRYFLFFSLTSTIFLMIYQYLGFFLNFDLTKVYDIRLEYVAAKIPLAGYFFSWLAYVINPIFFALFITKKKWFWVMLIVISQLFLFSVTGMKTFLFALPFVLVLIWIISRKNPIQWMAIGLIGIILLGMFSFWFLDDIWITSLFTRRTLLVPAQLSFFYYDFFSNNTYTFFSQHNIFRNFVEYPYNLSSSHLIAETYFNKPEMNAVNGIYGDAYMNFGFFGLFLWALLLSLILRLFDFFSKRKKITITIAAIAMPTMALVNSALLTCLLTHGLLLALVFLYLLPKQNEK